jgi:hypothetical protein
MSLVLDALVRMERDHEAARENLDRLVAEKVAAPV